MSSVPSYLAAAAVRGRSLYIFYRTSNTNLGTLFLVSANPPDAVAVVPTLPPLTSPLYVEAQTLYLGDLGLPALAQTVLRGISMVSTSMIDPQTRDYRHDILLALNHLQSRPQPPFPQPALVLRLAPQSPNIGDGQFAQTSATSGTNGGNFGPTWRVTDASLTRGLAPRSASNIVMSSGVVAAATTDPRADGTAIIQLTSTTDPISTVTNYVASKLDVTNGIMNGAVVSPVWVQGVLFEDVTTEPQIIGLSKSFLRPDIIVDAVAVGTCSPTSLPTVNSQTCFFFISKTKSIMADAPIEYNPSSCYVEGDGELLMVSPEQIMSLNLLTGIAVPRLAPSFVPYLPSPILACSKVGSDLYVVLKGNDTAPVIQKLDISKSQWTWQKTQLFSVSSDYQAKPPVNGSNGGGGSDKSSGLSTGAIAGISVAAVLVLLAGLGAAFFLYRKKHQKRQGERGGAEKFDNTAAATPSNQPPSSGYTPVYTSPQIGSPNVPVLMAAPAYMLSTATPSPGTTTISRNGSMEPEKHELSNYSPPIATFQNPPISRAWSNDGMIAAVPFTTAANNSYPITSTAGPYPVYPASQGYGNSSHTAISSHSLTPQYSLAAPSPVSVPGAIIGDKQEVTEEDDSGTLAESPEGRGMFSPGLANAQLILQQSQTPMPMTQPPSQPPPIVMQQMPYRPYHG